MTRIGTDEEEISSIRDHPIRGSIPSEKLDSFAHNFRFQGL